MQKVEITATTLKSQPADREITVTVMLPSNGAEADTMFGADVTYAIAVNGNGFRVWYQSWLRSAMCRGYGADDDRPTMNDKAIREAVKTVNPTVGRVRTTPQEKAAKAVIAAGVSMTQLQALMDEIAGEGKSKVA